jgi:8-oxo-dGTP pyrophosphatase MutT (NUDIX family)
MRAPTTEIIARAVIRRHGCLLLARERTKPWSFLPGGHVEPGEPIEVALARELGEELGTEATIVGFVGAVEHGYVAAGATHHELNLVFEVEIADADRSARRPTSSSTGYPSNNWPRLTSGLRDSRTPWWLLVRIGLPFWHGWSG